jgi:hypothetical protein
MTLKTRIERLESERKCQDEPTLLDLVNASYQEHPDPDLMRRLARSRVWMDLANEIKLKSARNSNDKGGVA